MIISKAFIISGFQLDFMVFFFDIVDIKLILRGINAI